MSEIGRGLSMNELSKQVSTGTQQLAQLTSQKFQAAKQSIVARLRTCDDRNVADEALSEIQIESGDASSSTTSSLTHIPTTASSSEIRNRPSLPIKQTGIALLAQADFPKLKGESWGDHNFQFSLSLDDGSLPSSPAPHPGCLVVTAKSPRPPYSPIRVKCVWKRKVGSHVLRIGSSSGRMYHPLSADDVASTVQVEVTSLDDGSNAKGTAYGEIGPFQIDAATRRILDRNMATGSTRFQVTGRVKRPVSNLTMSKRHIPGLDTSSTAQRLMNRSFQTGADDESEEFLLNLTSTDIKVVKPGPSNHGFVRECTAAYSVDYPLVELDPDRYNVFTLILSPRPDETFELETINRSQRDLVALTVRCFHAKQWVSLSALLERMAHLTHVKSKALDGQETTASEFSLDFLTVIHRLSLSLNQSMAKQDLLVKERDLAVSEKVALEQDMNATIEAYQKALAEKAGVSSSLNETSSVTKLDTSQSSAYVTELEKRRKEAEAKAEQYMEQLELLKRDLRQLEMKNADLNRRVATRAQSSMSEYALHDSDTLANLRRQLEALQSTNLALTSKEAEYDKQIAKLRLEASRSATGDQMRLASQVTKLSREKEALEGRLAALEADYKTVSENFLYVKEKLKGYEAEERKLNTSGGSGLNTSMLLTESRGVSAVEYEKLKGRVKDFTSEISNFQKELKILNAEKEKLRLQNERLQSQLEHSQLERTQETSKLLSALKEMNLEKDKTEKSNWDASRRSQQLSSSTAAAHLRSPSSQGISTTQQLLALDSTRSFIEVDAAARCLQLEELIRVKDEKINELTRENERLRAKVRELAHA